jgi:hypothetical protein
MLNHKFTYILAGIFCSSAIALTAQAAEEPGTYNYKVIINNVFPQNIASLDLICPETGNGPHEQVEGKENSITNQTFTFNNLQRCSKAYLSVNFLDSAGNSTLYQSKTVQGAANISTPPAYTVITFDAEGKTFSIQSNQH